jgi:hypothetical protein
MAELEPINAGYWYRVERNNRRDFEIAGDSDVFDFCGLPCLMSWAARRELIGAIGANHG